MDINKAIVEVIKMDGTCGGMYIANKILHPENVVARHIKEMIQNGSLKTYHGMFDIGGRVQMLSEYKATHEPYGRCIYCDKGIDKITSETFCIECGKRVYWDDTK